MSIQRLRKGRVQTQGFDAVQRITPAGLPGSTYVRPAENKGKSRDLYAIAEAFGGLSQTLSQVDNENKRQAAAQEAEQRRLEAEGRREAREARTEGREDARDARDAAKFKDEQDEQAAKDAPWDTMTPEQLKATVTANDIPGGNDYARRAAAVVLGKKAGIEFSNYLTERYAEYDPASGQTVRQFLEAESLKWMDENYKLEDRNGMLSRDGAWSVISTHIDSIEKKEEQFKATGQKAALTKGFDAEASTVLVEGKNKGLPAQTVANEFLGSWSALRKAADPTRANPDFAGTSPDASFKTAVQGLAEAGDVEQVEAILNTQAPGMRAALLKDPEHQQWAEETKAKAIKVATDNTQKSAYATRSNLGFLASQGELNDELIKASVDSGVIDPGEAEDLMTKSRVAKQQAIESARTAAGKSQAELSHNTAKDAITIGNLEVAMSGGGLSGLVERTVPAKDGSGTATVSVKEQQDNVVAAWEEQHKTAVEEVRVQQGEEAAAEYDMNQQIEFYGSNYQLENSRWRGLFDNMSSGASIRQWVNSGGKEVPNDVKQAMATYSSLAAKNPTLAYNYVKDEKTRVVLETYNLAKTRAQAYAGGGVATDEQALSQALMVADRIANNPEIVKGVFWNKERNDAIAREVQKTGQWPGGFDKAMINADMVADVKRMADHYAKTGMTEDDAIAEAVRVTQEDYVQANGDHLVNVKGISDKEGFVDFLDVVIPEKLMIARGGPQDAGLNTEDYRPVRMGDKWLLMSPSQQVLTDAQGKPVIITPDDFSRYKDRQMWKSIVEAERIAGGKKGMWETLFNGLTNAEDRGRFFEMKKKWEKTMEKENQWEQMRLDREGSKELSFDEELRKQNKIARAEGAADLDPSTYTVPLMASGTESNVVPTDLFSTMEQVESSGNATAVSPSGDHIGLMQVGHDTAGLEAAKALGMTDYVNANEDQRVAMLMNPETNRKLGQKYMTMMMDKYGDVETALVAYNWGPGNADKWVKGGRKYGDLPKETQDYLRKIMPNVKTSAQVVDDKFQFAGASGTTIRYANTGAKRNLRATPQLENKLDTAVAQALGPGYTVEIFSGGQTPKGERKRDVASVSRGYTGSTRHNHGKAVDIYVYGPDGKKVRDREKLLALKRAWHKNGYGGVGTFMSDFGMHLDEHTDRALAWNY
jgi:uncharacterized protein YcbK (DUF882 family)